ncbi:VirB3 family type IV secretion system protein [Brevundimonas diminuta]
MLASATYNCFIINAKVAAELFFITRFIWMLLAAIVIHGIGANHRPG